MSNQDGNSMDRRGFMKTSATVVAGSALLATGVATAKDSDDGLDHRNERPDKMSYVKLGRTNFMCSRLVFGCGAALAGGKAVRLLEEAFEKGINHYDVGYDDYYKGSEKSLSAFVKKNRDEVWVTSKAVLRNGMGATGTHYTTEMAKADAVYWLNELDKSLSRLDLDYVDAYYLMAVGNPNAVKSVEMHDAFQKAKQAGKVGHWGFSSHKRAGACLEAAIECGWHSLAMIAITPAGWYDWDTKSLLEDTPNLTALKPVLARAREAGIGLVGMKAGRFIAPATALGKNDTEAFNGEYSEKLMNAPFTPFQRSYAYVLENGMDVVNADMQNFKHFEDNRIAARDAGMYFA